MKYNRLTLLFLALFASLAIYAQGPNGSKTYYKDADGKKGAELKTALYGIISKKDRSPSYDDLIELYKQTDTRADGCVRDWYSNITKFTHVTDKAGSYSKEGDVYNREHSVPQSWGAPKADIVHVIPTDGYVNGQRGNLPFGEVGTVSYQSANGYSKAGSCKTAGYSGKVFEPNDEVKGDIARIYFYMVTCYEDDAPNWGGVFGGTKYQPMAQWTYNMMVRWSQLDPIDDVEIARNNAIAKSSVQGNRNPFVDYPGLEQYIWGSKQETAFSYDQYEGVEQDPNGGDDPGPGDDPQPGDNPTPTVDGTIMFSNTFFGIEWSEIRPTSAGKTYTGTEGGISVTYSLGTGQNMYANDQQIRLYAGNTLTFATNGAPMKSIVFNVAQNKENKQILASTDNVVGYQWSGSANEVTFTITEGSGHIRLTSATIGLDCRKGDANGDGLVDVSDVTAVISYILNRKPQIFNLSAADMNDDGQIDVSDVTQIINVIIGKGVSHTPLSQTPESHTPESHTPAQE